LTVSACSNTRGKTGQMFPDCTKATLEQQAKHRCVNRS
jgi:hypothetical protein